jgi:glutaredoxin
MKDLTVLVYSMKGCPFCEQFKEILTNEGIEYFDRDIDVYKDEYDKFSQITNNELIPALLIIEGEDKKYDSFLYAPDRDYNELNEAVDIIKNHIRRIN